MAFDPTKIGAQYKYTELLFTNISTTQSTQLVPYNPYRVCLMVACVSGTLYIRPNVAAILSQGIQIQNSALTLFRISMADSGPLCQQAWNGINNNAANSAYVISVEWIPEST